ncbi:MAG TPA: LLM class flavin-dependent oxidoreductase [Steroidobacteraceae bacterium]|nr:LLM class flavin-dependent oxidoreductase [Steroidobacteraceae bacterium]
MAVKFKISLTTDSYPATAYAALAAEIERLGFDTIYVSDDLPFRPVWPVLTLIAQTTKTIKLGPGLVTPRLAHPVYHASNLLVLDEISNGRAVCAVGVGGGNEMICGLVAKPVRMMREAMDIMHQMIERKQKRYEGEFFSVGETLRFHHGPERNIPLIMGSWGPQVCELAGKVAAGVQAGCVADIAYFSHLRERMIAGARSVGRDPAGLAFEAASFWCLSEDRAEALELMRSHLVDYIPICNVLCERMGVERERIDAITRARDTGDREGGKRLISDEIIRRFAVAGTPEGVIPHIEELVAAGATSVVVGPPLGVKPYDLDVLRMLAKRIVPHFR